MASKSLRGRHGKGETARERCTEGETVRETRRGRDGEGETARETR